MHVRTRLKSHTPISIASLATLTLIATVLLLFGAPALAAADTDDPEWGFTPRVVDTDGEGVEGALVSVSDESGNELGATTTGANGGGETIGVPDEGTYVITVDTSGIEASFVDGDVHALSRTLGAANTLAIQRVLVNLAEVANGGDLEFDGSAGGAAASISMTQILRQVVYGLNLGFILAVAVLGMTLIAGTTKLINFAYGDSLTVGALIAYLASIVLGLPIWVAGVLAIVAGMVLHTLLDTALLRPARRRGVAVVPLMIATIGVSFIVRYLGYAFYGGNTRRVTSATIPSVSIGPIVFPVSTFYIIGIASVAILSVMLWLRKSHAGRAIRAVAANRSLAAATGVNVDGAIRITWILSGALAGLAGILMSFLNNVSWDMGFKALLLIFAAMILGGVGSTRGAVVGSLIVGVLTEVLVLWLPSDMKFVGGLAVLIVVLLVRPQGIFGRAERVG